MADGAKLEGLPGESLRKRYERRVESMRQRRLPLEQLYQALSDNYAPLRYRRPGDLQASQTGMNGQASRFSKHADIYNSTPKIVYRTLASGLHAGLSSPSRPWFRLLTSDREMVEFGPVKSWLGAVEDSMRRIFARSNTYRALPFLYGEWGLFGTMAALVFDDPQTVIRIEPMTCGSYWLAENRYGRVDTLARERMMTVRQILQEFERERIPQSIINAAKSGRLEQAHAVVHMVTPGDYGTGAPFSSCYWLKSSDKPDEFLAERSFASDPLLTARWEEVPGDVYGTDCPGITALSPVKQLQKEEDNIARVNEIRANPPLQAPISLANTGLTTVPGEVNYVVDTTSAGGIRSIYDFRPDDGGLRQSKQDLVNEVRQAFYYDLFLLLTNDERNQRATAEEIRALYGEKVVGLGPVLEQGNPMLSKLIERTFAIGVARSEPVWRGVLDGDPLFPEPPEELRSGDVEIEVEFISTLQQAQRQGALESIERFMSFAGNLAAASQDPGVMDKVDLDQALDEYGAALYVPPEVVRSDEEVEAIREGRAQTQQMQQMAAMAPALKDAAGAAASLATARAEPGSLLEGALSGAAATGAPGGAPGVPA